MASDRTAVTVLAALEVRFADGSRPSTGDALRLILDEEGPEAVVAAVLDAASQVDMPDAAIVTPCEARED